MASLPVSQLAGKSEFKVKKSGIYELWLEHSNILKNLRINEDFEIRVDGRKIPLMREWDNRRIWSEPLKLD